MIQFITDIATVLGGIIMAFGGILLTLSIVVFLVERLRTRVKVLGLVLEYLRHRKEFRTWREAQQSAPITKSETISEAAKQA